MSERITNEYIERWEAAIQTYDSEYTISVARGNKELQYLTLAVDCLDEVIGDRMIKIKKDYCE